MSARTEVLDYAGAPEATLVALAKGGDGDAFRALMQRCNQRLFRTARSIVGNDAEAEDVLQEAYVRAFAAFGAFRGDAGVLTWLTRIVINEAHGRLRKRRRVVGLEAVETAQASNGLLIFPSALAVTDPEKEAARTQARRLIERAVDQLPEAFRLVFILREVEDCGVEETAELLGLKPATVKTRLHRARRLLKERLRAELESVFSDTFPFLGPRCERITQAVLDRMGIVSPAQGPATRPAAGSVGS